MKLRILAMILVAAAMACWGVGLRSGGPPFTLGGVTFSNWWYAGSVALSAASFIVAIAATILRVSKKAGSK